MTEDQSFVISQTTSDDDFKNRTSSIFGCLDSLEKKYEQSSCHLQEDVLDSEKQEPNETFKRPTQQLWRGRQSRGHKKTPDHVVNPGKWTKYSLKEDGSREVSKGLSAEQLNKKIAIDFLDNLKQRKKEVKNMEIPTAIHSADEKVLYSKPSTKVVSETTMASSSIFGSSHGSKAHVMDAFHFGNKNNTRCPSDKKKGNHPHGSKRIVLDLNEASEEEIDSADSAVLNAKIGSKKSEDEERGAKVHDTDKQEIVIKKRKLDTRVIRKRTADVDDA